MSVSNPVQKVYEPKLIKQQPISLGVLGVIHPLEYKAGIVQYLTEMMLQKQICHATVS
jgi:hypothetical protein